MTAKVYCDLPFKRMKVNTDGCYHSCCHQKTTYDNLITSDLTLEEAFQNPLLKEVQEHVLNNKLHPICNTTRCPFYDKRDNLQEHLEYEVEINPSQPDNMELSLPSTHCNIGGTNPTKDTACIMCPRASKTFMEDWEPKEPLIDKVVQKIKPYIDKIKTINVQGIAEPFWKGKVLEILKDLDFEKNKDHVFFWSFTNGSVFGDKIQDEFISTVRWSSLGFSIDAATPETYMKVRRLNYFKTIERNIINYVKKIAPLNEKGEQWFHVFTTYNINMLNVHEMEEMVRWSKAVGAHRTEFTLTFNGSPEFILGEENICNEHNWQIFWEGQQKALKVAEELDHPVSFYVPFHGGFLKQ